MLRVQQLMNASFVMSTTSVAICYYNGPHTAELDLHIEQVDPTPATSIKELSNQPLGRAIGTEGR